MNAWLLLAGMAAVTFLIRYLPLASAGRLRLPPLLERALQYVPVAVLSAIIAPAALLRGPENGIDLSLGNAYGLTALVAALVAWRSRSLTLTVLVGLAFFGLWKGLLGPMLGG